MEFLSCILAGQLVIRTPSWVVGGVLICLSCCISAIAKPVTGRGDGDGESVEEMHWWDTVSQAFKRVGGSTHYKD